MTIPNISGIGALQILDYVSTVAVGSTAPPNDFGMVASIDGCTLILVVVWDLLTDSSIAQIDTFAFGKRTATDGISNYTASTKSHRRRNL